MEQAHPRSSRKNFHLSDVDLPRHETKTFFLLARSLLRFNVLDTCQTQCHEISNSSLVDDWNVRRPSDET